MARTDQAMGDLRWLSVSPTTQPDIEIALLKPGAPMHDDDATRLRRGHIPDDSGNGFGLTQR